MRGKHATFLSWLTHFKWVDFPSLLLQTSLFWKLSNFNEAMIVHCHVFLEYGILIQLANWFFLFGEKLWVLYYALSIRNSKYLCQNTFVYFLYIYYIIFSFYVLLSFSASIFIQNFGLGQQFDLTFSHICFSPGVFYFI
jgi:hypothetical protein